MCSNLRFIGTSSLFCLLSGHVIAYYPRPLPLTLDMALDTYLPYVMTDTISLTACALFVVCSVDAFSRILSALWSSTTTPRAHAELHTSTVFLNDIDGLQHPDSFTFIPNTFFKQLRTETSRKTGIDEQSSRLAREFQRTFLYT